MKPRLIETAVETCPECGFALDLYSKPINVRFLLCCNCEREYTEDYMAGYRYWQRRNSATPAQEPQR